jgi:hypothetical protein
MVKAYVGDKEDSLGFQFRQLEQGERLGRIHDILQASWIGVWLLSEQRTTVRGNNKRP